MTPAEARKQLGQMNVQYSEDSFIESAAHGDTVAVDLFLVAGINPNARHSKGKLAYTYAPFLKDNSVLYYVDAKEALNQIGPRLVTYDGATALMAAAAAGSETVVRSLVQKGADIKMKDRVNFTALAYAAWMRSPSVVSVLLAAGADPNSEEAPTPIMMACISGDEEIASQLLNAGADPNSRFKGGHTSLMFACEADKTSIVKMLLEKGADVHLKNQNGDDPIKIATQNGNQEILALLKKAGA